MIEKTTVFKTTDGKTFKTEAGAKKHQDKLEYASKLKEKGMTADELQAKVVKTAELNPNFRALIAKYERWEKFPPNIIHQIFTKWDTLFNENLKTKYVRTYRHWGEVKFETIATEEGSEFTAADLHCSAEKPWDELVVVKENIVNSQTKEIILDFKYSLYEKSLMKLRAGEKLNESEIRHILHNSEEVYEKSGEDRRWSRSVTTVIKIDDEMYAIDWEQGLTENQENEYYEQPYKVKLEKTPITVIQTRIISID